MLNSWKKTCKNTSSQHARCMICVHIPFASAAAILLHTCISRRADRTIKYFSFHFIENKYTDLELKPGTEEYSGIIKQRTK